MKIPFRKVGSIKGTRARQFYDALSNLKNLTDVLVVLTAEKMKQMLAKLWSE